MMVAELHGKVASRVRDSEDVLTSYAFGVLESFEPAHYLLPWLAKAQRPDGQRLSLHGLRTTFAFWPSLELSESTVEPDLLISLHDEGAATTLILIEAKFRSGPSGWPTGPDVAEVTGQLGRQWLALGALPLHLVPGEPDSVQRRVLVYLTADLARPDSVLTAMAEEVRKAGGDSARFSENLYWLGWRELAPVLRSPPDPPLFIRRLADLLVARELSPFSGCAPPAHLGVDWRYLPPEYDLASPQVGRAQWNYGGP